MLRLQTRKTKAPTKQKAEAIVQHTNGHGIVQDHRSPPSKFPGKTLHVTALSMNLFFRYVFPLLCYENARPQEIPLSSIKWPAKGGGDDFLCAVHFGPARRQTRVSFTPLSLHGQVNSKENTHIVKSNCTNVRPTRSKLSPSKMENYSAMVLKQNNHICRRLRTKEGNARVSGNCTHIKIITSLRNEANTFDASAG